MTTPPQSDPMGGVLSGSADLQSSIDRLDDTMEGLTTAIQGISNGNGMTTSPAMASSLAAQGVAFSGGSYAGAGGGSNGAQSNLGSGGYNGSGGTSGVNPFSITGGSGSGAQALVNVASSAINGQFLAGAQQLGDQATINTYGYTQAAFWNVSSKSAITTAFGGGNGSNMTQNNMATSASDARIGGQLLSQISGQANYTAPAGGTYGRGNGAFGLAAATAMANPGLGMASSAGVAGQFYNASTSYNLMMMGVNTTPLQLGTGKTNNINAVEGAIGQRFGFQGYNSATGTFNSQNLSANLDNPLFQMQIMDATGMSQSQYNTWSQQWAQENTAAVGSKTTMNQMQNEVGQYMNGTATQQKAAQSWLSQHGMSQSLLQSMTQSQAGQTAAEAGGNQAFTQGLQDATSEINKFTAALAKGLQSMAGTSGFAGAVGSLNSSGVVGAGAGGISNTVIDAIAGNVSSLGKDITGLAADLTGYTSSSSGGSGGVSASGGNPASKSTEAANQKLGKQMASAWGWGSGSQWTALNNVEMAEAGWNNYAQNPTSTAFGIGQFLNSTWATVGATKTTNAAQQISAMYNYIYKRYGNPEKAWAHEQQYNWYSDGSSSTKPGLAVVGERGPEVVAMSGGQQIINAAQTAKMLQPTFGGGVGGPMGGGGLSIVFQSGSITMTTSGINVAAGTNNSNDVQSTAASLVQAIETGLNKSQVIRNIAAGVTG